MFRLAFLLVLAAGAPPPQDRRQASAPELNPKTEQAIAKALDWLASRQARDGSFGGSVALAHTSLACLAFLGSGSTPHEGRYSNNIHRGIRYIRKCRSKSGFLTDQTGVSGMYGHGYATLLLAECVGMLHEPDEIDSTRDALS